MQRADAGQDAGTTVPEAVLRATRSLLEVTEPADAHRVACQLVADLGGSVVDADRAGADAIPADVSFGVGGPALPVAGDETAQRLLDRYLPAFVTDANRSLHRALQRERLVEHSSRDALTGLSNRRLVNRALGRLRPGETVVVIDLDHFKRLNDHLGHEEGDRVLAAFGRCLLDTVRGRDLVGRYGGEEFVAILVDDTEPEGLLARLRETWEQQRPRPVTFSAGIARAGDDPTTTFGLADQALYRAKEEGRDRWRWASRATEQAAPAPVPVPAPPEKAFVAFSELRVPASGAPTLEAAFANRLGAVDRWPGFHRLEAWQDHGDPEHFVLVTWWDSAEAFQAYMGSEDHRASHGRIPEGDDRPRPDRFTRFRVITR